MAKKEFKVARLTEEEMEKLSALEEEFSQKRDRRVALVAYESEEEFALAQLDEEEQEELKSLEEKFAEKKNRHVAMVVYESRKEK